MRRLFLAATLAFILHALLLSMKADWLKNDDFDEPDPRTLSVSLSYLIPEKEAPVIIKEPEPEVVKKAPIPEKKIIQKSVRKKPLKRKMTPLPVEPPVEKPEKEAPTENKPETARPLSIRPIYEVPHTQKEVSAEKKIEVNIRETPPPAPSPQPSPQPPPKPPASPAVVEAVPAYSRNPPPEYPRLARRRRYEGTVLLEVLVDTTGKVGDIRLSDSSGYPVLDRAAMKSVRAWLFEPGRRGDEPVEMWVKVPVRFHLR